MEYLSEADMCIDVLGSMAFTPVKNDMIGNIKVGPLRTPTFSAKQRELNDTRKSAIVN